MPKYMMLISIEKNIELFAGDVISKKIMEGSEALTEKTDKTELALWVQSAMERMDSPSPVVEKTRDYGELWLQLCNREQSH